MEPRPAPFPPALLALGADVAAFEPVLAAQDLPAGSLRRINRGDLDILLAHALKALTVNHLDQFLAGQ